MKCKPDKCPVENCFLQQVCKFESCALRKSLKILGGKRALPILVNLQEPRRFGELKRDIPDISEKMLIQTLRELEEHKFVKRKDYQTIPPKVVYSLYQRGRKALELVPTLISLGSKL